MELVGRTAWCGLAPESFPSTTAGTAEQNVTDFPSFWKQAPLSFGFFPPKVPRRCGIKNSTGNAQGNLEKNQAIIRLTALPGALYR